MKKVITIDGNKLLGLKDKHEIFKDIISQIREQMPDSDDNNQCCNCDNEDCYMCEDCITPIDEEFCECDVCNNRNECEGCDVGDDAGLNNSDLILELVSKINELSKLYKEESDLNKVNDNQEKKNNNDYSFEEMIEEFTNGYTGTFTDGKDLYTFMEGTLLFKTEVGVFPVPLSMELLGDRFSKKEIVIDNTKALELAIEGQNPKFSVDLYGRTYTGHLSMINGVPSYKINGDVIGNSETIILGALMTGKWYF